MQRNSSLTPVLKIVLVISLLLCVCYVIGGLNAIYVAKSLSDGNSTSPSGISRRIEKGFSYFKIAGVFLAVFLTSTYAFWRKTKNSCGRE